MKNVKKMPRFSEEELKKYYEQIYRSHKISDVKKKKQEVRGFKRNGRYEYE